MGTKSVVGSTLQQASAVRWHRSWRRRGISIDRGAAHLFHSANRYYDKMIASLQSVAAEKGREPPLLGEVHGNTGSRIPA